jgi:hypothetical protein
VPSTVLLAPVFQVMVRVVGAVGGTDRHPRGPTNEPLCVPDVISGWLVEVQLRYPTLQLMRCCCWNSRRPGSKVTCALRVQARSPAAAA